MPYGGRSPEILLKYARQDVHFLRSFDIKAILVACGTVSTTCLPVLRQENDRLTAQWKQSYDAVEHAAPNELLISLLDFYKEHSDFCLALYQAGLSDIVLQTLLDQSEITPEMPNAIAYLKSSIAYMLYGWIVEWMKRGMQESGTELAKMFEEAQGTGINQ